MYCQTCGNAIAHKTKYCNRCGTQLVPAGEASPDKTPAEKRLDEYLDGLFWISVFGLGFIIGPALGGLFAHISYTAPIWAAAAITV